MRPHAGDECTRERAFLGFTVLESGRISIAPRSVMRFKAAVRELWDARQSRTSRELVRQWRQYLRGWCNYFALAEARWSIRELEGWVRHHMRKCFWLRWHNRAGRLQAFKRLGAKPYHWRMASSRLGAWPVSRSPALHTVLNTRILRQYGLWVPSDFWAAQEAVRFNRRMRKTACPVVWEG